MAEGKHRLVLDARRELAVTGIKDVESFDETRIELATDLGGLVIEGVGMKVASLDLDAGSVTVTGEIGALAYGKSKEEKSMRHKSKSVMSRLLK